jgi:hypothetical protein
MVTADQCLLELSLICELAHARRSPLLLAARTCCWISMLMEPARTLILPLGACSALLLLLLLHANAAARLSSAAQLLLRCVAAPLLIRSAAAQLLLSCRSDLLLGCSSSLLLLLCRSSDPLLLHCQSASPLQLCCSSAAAPLLLGQDDSVNSSIGSHVANPASSRCVEPLFAEPLAYFRSDFPGLDERRQSLNETGH